MVVKSLLDSGLLGYRPTELKDVPIEMLSRKKFLDMCSMMDHATGSESHFIYYNTIPKDVDRVLVYKAVIDHMEKEYATK